MLIDNHSKYGFFAICSLSFLKYECFSVNTFAEGKKWLSQRFMAKIFEAAVGSGHFTSHYF